MAQSLDDIVKVNVIVSPMAQSAGTFNIGLIVGKSKSISASDRIKIYSSLPDMSDDGWKDSDPEYAAAKLYYSQSPSPSKLVVGRWDDTETVAEAIKACRAANNDWYACYVVDATSKEIEAVASEVEAMKPESVYFYTTADEAVKAGTTGNIMETLKNKAYKRTWGQYSTTPHAAAAAMGYAMGANTGGANSAYTLAYKTEVGVSPEPLSTTEVQKILALNGNVYTAYGAKYKLLVQGKMASGVHFDEVLNLDMLQAEIQIGATNALVGTGKIPQTEDGMALLISAISEQCDKSVTRGAIAPGVWKAGPVLTLNQGDTLSKGYMVLAERIADQTQDERDARKAPPIYVPVKMAGAIEHVVINVTVNR
ncbi:DUF3383 domain-containing protein [Brevibacillus halotolerans]|uniref:DUF3383 domain-containing protein n=1 Tax=Brevibacillus TaxID=55080 RepID=UPI00215C463D|nr:MULTISPECIES: DUF3383 domain-containing protein [Brevibacillus]MCR8961661.1 DUF3383 domain-containing protein [Brevibacillus laterosporus]MCZ0833816.1 DUF3383 domain-containing protein [Brevibacillus halotolerans]